MACFPIYILEIENDWKIVFPETREDISHGDFWDHVVSKIVAETFRISQKRLINLPYCQRRARIVNDNVYYGEKPEFKLLKIIRKTIGNNDLKFVYDDHEKRLKEDARAFKRLFNVRNQ